MQPLPRKILHSEVGTGIRPGRLGRSVYRDDGVRPGVGRVWSCAGRVWSYAEQVRPRCGTGAAPHVEGPAWRCGEVRSCGAAGVVLRRAGAVLRCGWCGPAVRWGAVLWRGGVARLVRLVRACGAVWRLRPVSLARSGAWRREAPSRTRQGRARRPLRARRSGR